MEINTLSKNELIEIIDNISRVIKNYVNYNNEYSFEKSKRKRNDLEDLIGTIPFLLLNEQIFEKNQDIADFANKLNIKIPSPEKKKKEDMIGRIIAAIARFDKKKIIELNYAIKSLKNLDTKRGKSSFFKDWEEAIKQMKI